MINSLNGNLQWKELQAIDISDDNDHEISYSNLNLTEVMVYYGRKNSEQSYGGASIVLNGSPSKPCFLPVYDNNTLIGIAFIYINPISKSLLIKRQNGNVTFRFIVFYR